jgi:hypothetical protein
VSNALKQLHILPQASAAYGVAPRLLVAIDGSLAAHAAAMAEWWDWVRSSRFGRVLGRWRGSGETSWRNVTSDGVLPDLDAMLGPVAASRWLNCIDATPNLAADDGGSLMLHDAGSVMGQRRASTIEWWLPAAEDAEALRALATAALEHLPLMWASAGYGLRLQHGRADVARRARRALAKRYWCVQWLDGSALQWDALQGLGDIGWLTLIGHDFASSRGLSLAELARRATESSPEHLHAAGARFGLALSAGLAPVRGDINLNEDITAYRQASALLLPLRRAANERDELAWGPSVAARWLARFEAPAQWHDVRVAEFT